RGPAAHRACRQLARDDHAVAALGTVELALGAGARGPERHVRRRVCTLLHQRLLIHTKPLPASVPCSFLTMPILRGMETPEFLNAEPAEPERPQRPARPAPRPLPQPGSWFWSAGARISWIAGLVLALSSFMDWYAGSSAE